ncbi:MAG: hypothetical protein RXQ68_00635 [Candidatus Nanopusillus sp.]
MSEIPNIPLNTRVYAIRRKNNLDEILAYQIDQEKRFISYTFQTKREIPKVLEIYRKIRDEYYPAAFIVPSPSPEMNRQPIPFDGNFALVVGYTKEIPPYVPLNNLIRTYYIEIIKEKNKLLEMHINGVSGIDILQNREELREYILYLEKVTNQEDLINLIIYNEKYPTTIGENKMMKNGWFIVIDDDTSKNYIFTPTNVKIFEIFI